MLGLIILSCLPFAPQLTARVGKLQQTSSLSGSTPKKENYPGWSGGDWQSEKCSLQSKRATVIETVVDVGVGYVLSWIVSMLVLVPLGIQSIAGEPVSVTVALISLIYVAVSLVRKYWIRRIYERYFRKNP